MSYANSDLWVYSPMPVSVFDGRNPHGVYTLFAVPAANFLIGRLTW